MLISRRARDLYQFDADLLNAEGRLAFADFEGARRAAAKISARRTQSVPPSDLHAMALLDEVLRILLRQYVLQNPGVVQNAAAFVGSNMVGLDQTLARFLDEFPPSAVYRGEISVEEFFSPMPAVEERGAREKALEDVLLIDLANRNPALGAYKELIDDSELRRSGGYVEVLSLLSDFFGRQPAFGAGGAGGMGTLLEVLAEPARRSPNSLQGQLRFLIEKWGFLLGEVLLQRLLRGLDYLREEVIRHHGAGGFKPDVHVPDYRDYPEYERFSPDKEWMPRLVLMARNTYVWLEQLSRKHQRWIKTLDQIPDDELDLLARRGFTGLWLIGLWERSRASQRIKQRMGQSDAVASAYSLHGYDIAQDLGGWEALNNLRGRAWARGIRLSADMVPNHMGIDSAWVVEHPDWFLSADEPPYASYTFNSQNLSDDGRVAVILEDHYYDHSDAAVVFKRLDTHTGDSKYIYHGNDGTAFPWNDTAQLDYTRGDVREAVIQTILHVARNFPIIRFDAAMTLAKKHIQRLWFPEPGAGGAIPSRAERGLTRAEFDAKMPEEFWREVVDRVAVEVPDTLLLAEAFWLMEGYFVRTLGMHRVYNSAFMHMLRDEDNAKYRQLIKNTLEFDPQILKRYVNFMNNPDEKTAIEQFGTSDKYFGVCTLLGTLPGLPMFGHGQIEGFREKYGMEFRMPKLDEKPDDGLVAGHDWKIFPLLLRRNLFADVDNFLLYDMFGADGRVNEDVIAYSNRADEDRGLVIYHNRFADARGWLKTSAAYLEKGSGELRQMTLAEGLGLPYEGFVIFKDYVTRLEYIRSCEDLWAKGLYLELGAYQHHAFLDWRFETDERWQAVHDSLGGAGVESLQLKWDEMYIEPVAALGTTSQKQKAKRAVKADKAAKKATVLKKASTTKKAVGKSGAKAKTSATSKKSAAKASVTRTKTKAPAKKKTATKKTVKKASKTAARKSTR